MKISKIYFMFFIILALLLVVPNISEAATEYTYLDTEQGIEWTYELDKSNNVINLKCETTSKIGAVTIPSTIDGKTVITIGKEAFKSATEITEVVIPTSVTKIEYNAFENCTKLNKVDLGSVETLSFGVFKSCTSLTEITIPKTLKNGAIEPCLDNENITKITLEEGLTVVPQNLCANTGITEIVIPSSVTEIDASAFANTGITEIIIPNSVIKIGNNAFENCTKLNKIDLGNVETLSFGIFKGCTSLTKITIPKTLKNGAIDACLDNPSITKITLEEGITIVPQNLCANTGITEIIIPNSVIKIGNNAFENCTKLNKVDLGSVETLSFGIFKGCTSLTKITIPKTLKNGAIDACLDNENITKITLEEGLTVVPQNLCANTGITEIVIPSSVTEIDASAFANTGITEIIIPNSVIKIGNNAFENCTKLNKIDLGNVETLSFGIFKGCTSLTKITIPKTLKNGAVDACLDNSSITQITLEEGITVVPQNLCANTGITEIIIPNSVTKIEFSAFDDCTQLKKITILDNVTEMGFYTIEDSDSIFKNHDEDLTIYCYRDSMAAKYAIKYNIKYVYLNKPNMDENNKNEEDKTDETKDTEQKEDSTTAPGKLPQAGLSTGILLVIVIVFASGIVVYFKYKKLRDI